MLGTAAETKFFLQSLGYSKAKFTRPSLGSGSLHPGDIIAFKYLKEDSSTRIVIIVGNQRGPTGFFMSTQGKLLLSCFKLSGPEVVISTILFFLYKNRTRASYNFVTDSLKVILGEVSYRTYIVDNMSDILQIHIPKDLINATYSNS